MSSNPTPVKVPKQNTSICLNTQGLTELKTVQVKNLRVGQKFRHEHDKRVYTIIEVTNDKIGLVMGKMNMVSNYPT